LTVQPPRVEANEPEERELLQTLFERLCHRWYRQFLLILSLYFDAKRNHSKTTANVVDGYKILLLLLQLLVLIDVEVVAY
jgi:hypothetical protein